MTTTINLGPQPDLDQYISFSMLSPNPSLVYVSGLDELFVVWGGHIVMYEYAFAAVSEMVFNTWTSPKMKVELWKKHCELKKFIPALLQADFKDVNSSSQFNSIKFKISNIVCNMKAGEHPRATLLAKETPQGILDWFNPDNAVTVGMTS